jgi:hypothetical protein
LHLQSDSHDQQHRPARLAEIRGTEKIGLKELLGDENVKLLPVNLLPATTDLAAGYAASRPNAQSKSAMTDLPNSMREYKKTSYKAHVSHHSLRVRCDAVCIFVNDCADASVIADLKTLGVKLLLLRSAGCTFSLSPDPRFCFFSTVFYCPAVCALRAESFVAAASTTSISTPRQRQVSRCAASQPTRRMPSPNLLSAYFSPWSYPIHFFSVTLYEVIKRMAAAKCGEEWRRGLTVGNRCASCRGRTTVCENTTFPFLVSRGSTFTERPLESSAQVLFRPSGSLADLTVPPARSHATTFWPVSIILAI